jgi:signal transduction histidine kinase/ligand-binding sensor domain-containing protein/CheY-like chemotaxis protein
MRLDRIALPLALSVLFGGNLLFALDPTKEISQYSVRNWKADDGLGQHSVNAIVQAPDGYLWMATQEGIARFDGARFTRVSKKEAPRHRNPVAGFLVARDGSVWVGGTGGVIRYVNGVPRLYGKADGLVDEYVWSLTEGPDGSIWLGTSGGVNRFLNGRFTAYTTKDGLPSNAVWVATMARDGALWIGMNGAGIARRQGPTISRFTSREGLAHDVVWQIYEDRQGTIWIGTNRGLSRYSGGRVVKVPMIDDLDVAPVKAIYEDRHGALWIGTERHGLIRYYQGRFTRPRQGEPLYTASVYSIFEDAEGSLWVGTAAGGVFQLLTSKFTMIGPPEGLVSEEVWTLCETRDGALWVGTNDGLSRIKDGRITNHTTGLGDAAQMMRSLHESRDGALWFATYGGLGRMAGGKMTLYRAPQGLSVEIARAVVEDDEGTIWIGTRGGGVNSLRDGVFTVYNSAKGFLNDIVYNASKAADGSIWFATYGGVSRMHGGTFTDYTTRDGLSSEATRVIHHDGDTHWVGTYGGGLNRIKDGRITPIRARDGLADDIVLTIIDDQRGSLWMSSNRGIFRVSKQQLNDFADGKISGIHSDAYNQTDGMRTSECNSGSPASARTRDGRLWFATLGGVAIIDPATVPRNDVPPPVWNEELFIDGKAVGIGTGELSVGPGNHSLEIHYTALSYVAPKKVLFRYRLTGFDKEWVEAGNRRVAFYTNIPPGHYVFEVMGSNNDGLWRPVQNPLRLHFRTPFHRTWWFYALLTLAVVAAAWRAHKFQLKLTRAESLVRTAELERSLTRSQKMESLGQMAAGIAHDFNNTMMSALPWAEIVRRKYPHDPTLQKSMENIRAAVMRAREVTVQLLDFAQPKPPKTEPVNLTAFLRQQLVILRPSVPPEIAIEVRAQRDDLAVSADTTQLSQLVVNLALNARDAMPGGGRLRFEIRELTEKDAARWGCSPQNFVVFGVSDTGVGIDEATRHRIFDPFFTTKDVGKGAGLGLAVVHRIVEQHRGAIFVDSTVNGGTTFSVLLPRVQMAAEPALLPSEDRLRGRLTGTTVLLVDDEVQVCEGVKMLLEMEGALVRETHRGAEALALLTEGLRPHLIVLDLGLPEMPGEEVYERIRARLPRVPIVIASGYAHSARGRLCRGVHTRFQQKPYDVEGLVTEFLEMRAGAATA